MSRRLFLIGLGIGAVATASVGTALLSGAPVITSGSLDDEWRFGPFVAGCTAADFDDSELAAITVPHCVAPLSWQDWDPATWEALWVYRRRFDAPAELRSGRAFLRFDGVLTTATVYLNGQRIGFSDGGYLPLTCEVTGRLVSRTNVLAVVVDGRWHQDVPPDLPRFPEPDAIDFYQPAGIYRPVSLLAAPKTFVSDVFAEPVDVLTGDRALNVHCTTDSLAPVTDPVRLTATVSQRGTLLASTTADLPGLPLGSATTTLRLTGLAAVRLWDVTDPALCDVVVTLGIGGTQVHQVPVRTGFREATFTEDGFFLNGRRLKLFGVNRHQWYPFVGGAMPDRVQRRDAQLLKEQLNCTMVRCSVYPHSTAFLDACDELGLLAWEEIPGWDFLGDARWRDRALDNVSDMVVRDRNHPSVIVWGTRVNEALGHVDLYDRADLLAQQLDPSRPCTGATSGARGYREALFRLADGGTSVFSYNDYTKLHRGHTQARLRPPRDGTPYLVSEAVGTLIGPTHFQRTDPVSVQSEQGLLHAWVHERAAADDRYSGLLAWCGFDYPSGWLHSVDGVKYPGVSDIFRIPKLGAAFYQSQVDLSTRVVIEPGFYWDFGPDSPPSGPGRAAIIWSNCDVLRLYLDGRRVQTVWPQRKLFPHLAYPPFVADLTVDPGHQPELRIDGFVGSNLVLRRWFSPDPSFDTLSCVADDQHLEADGQDATRVVLRVLDRYGAPRPFVAGSLAFTVSGPAVLVGDNPLDFAAAGGACAVWLRSVRGQTGQVSLTAAHPTLGTAATAVHMGATGPR
jgi:beta-galactosidase